MKSGGCPDSKIGMPRQQKSPTMYLVGLFLFYASRSPVAHPDFEIGRVSRFKNRDAPTTKESDHVFGWAFFVIGFRDVAQHGNASRCQSGSAKRFESRPLTKSASDHVFSWAFIRFLRYSLLLKTVSKKSACAELLKS